MYTSIFATVLSLVVFVVPELALAQSGPTATFGQIGVIIRNVIAFINNYLVPLLFAAAFLVFIYGIFKYFIQGGADDDKREEGKKLMIWGILGFVIMVSVWGLVNVIAQSLGFREQQIQQIPNVPQTR